MPFREVSVMDQRREFVVFAFAEGANVSGSVRRLDTHGSIATGNRGWRR
jgi:hypothetical protein